ncbi:related to glucan 1,3-beta-glucosidase [Cephalotrichum gorgonifer]|uniref:Probable glucan endo-1,3-beta-glucosidase eglC n=1 Tax=Cephalotrichum gorgonifer TaxID=2041049 RepID=A0AAE8MRX6_9PEZI|nr:related to glucan 1,3-beta-glucosidase [Cephalotrichum gorgonifer]
MRPVLGSLALAAAVSTASAAFQGFNYGNTFTNGQAKVQSDFEAEFKTAQGLKGTNGAFKSARLYTMVQGNTKQGVIEAIPAAIKTKTSVLLGLWASAGSETFNNEITALKTAISQYGDDLAPLVAGISVGSEDLYRASPVGIAAGEFAGADPNTLVNYIDMVRDAIRGTPLQGAKIGHVDTWTAYVNGSNSAVIEACDWIGMDAYPYFEDTHPNEVSNGANLFRDALGATKAAGGGKEVWITETGWPVSGKKFGSAVPSPDNARKFWRDVGCPMFGVTNVWWYTLRDAAPDTPNPSFGVVGPKGNETLYDLSCEGISAGGNDDSNDSGNSSDDDDSNGSTNDGGSNGSNNGSANEDGDDSSNGSGGNGDEDTGSSNNSSDSDSGSDDGGSSSGGDNSGGSGSDSTSGSGSNSNSDAGSGSGTDEGAEDEGDGHSGSTHLNSIGASVVAILGAVALL